MKEREHCIFMADIINSRNSNQKQLMLNFQEVTKAINKRYLKQFSSPITITLGDEFQSVVKNVSSAIQIIISIEEEIIIRQSGFKLRYVLLEGEIDTPINEEIAYEMLGDGLTRARKALQDAKLTKNRFHFKLKNFKVSQAFNNSFLIYQSLTDDWNVNKDHDLISEFLKSNDYKAVAEKLGKTRSQIWKREKSLKISEYIAIKEVIKFITG